MATVPLRHARAFLLAVAVSACQRSPGASGELQFGAAGAWTTGYGAMAQHGIELAVSEMNAAGGINGQRINVTFRDDQADGELAADIARDFVADEKIVGVIGHLSSGAMVAAARIYDGQLAAVSPTTTSPDLTGMSDWMFRLSPSDSMTGRKLGELVRTKFGKRRIAIIYDNTAYGRGLVEPFLDGLNLAPVALEPIDPTGENIDANVTAIARQNPDLIFAVGTSSGVPVLKSIREHGITAPVLAGDGWSGIENMMETRNVMVALPFSPDVQRPETQRFISAFRARYKVDPDAYAALTYDATLAMARAAAQGRTRKATRDAIAAMNDSKGYASGTVHFSRNGDPLGQNMHLLTINGAQRAYGAIQ
jgi:branched-chain amino acid transport system substrate-binding protein